MNITIYGDPKAQKRPRFARRGKFVTTYDPSKLQKDNFICQLIKHKPAQPLDCPIVLKCKYFLPIPKSLSKRKKVRLANETTPHVKRPDIDNLDKFIMDCMNSIFYNDDSQIFSKQSVKLYSNVPRTEITIDTIENVDRKDFTSSEAVKAWQIIEAKKQYRDKKGHFIRHSESEQPIEQAVKLYSNVPRTEIELESIENEDRKDLTPSEAVEEWQKIERPKGGRGKTTTDSVRVLASKITGIGKDNLRKAKQVVDYGDQDLIDMMDNRPQTELFLI